MPNLNLEMDEIATLIAMLDCVYLSAIDIERNLRDILKSNRIISSNYTMWDKNKSSNPLKQLLLDNLINSDQIYIWRKIAHIREVLAICREHESSSWMPLHLRHDANHLRARLSLEITTARIKDKEIKKAVEDILAISLMGHTTADDLSATDYLLRGKITLDEYLKQCQKAYGNLSKPWVLFACMVVLLGTACAIALSFFVPNIPLVTALLCIQFIIACIFGSITYIQHMEQPSSPAESMKVLAKLSLFKSIPEITTESPDITDEERAILDEELEQYATLETNEVFTNTMR